jgi:hypothetical protein
MNGLRIVLADPDPVGLPAEVWLLKVLLIFTFVLHLFFMNAVLGGGAVWLWANWRARRAARRGAHASAHGDYRLLASGIGRLLPVATAFAITTGVAPLLFTQLLYGQLFYTSSVLMAWPWFAIVLLLLAGYYANYGIGFSRPATGRALVLGLASFVLFVAIGFLFTNNMTLMLRPEQHAPLYFASDAGMHLNASRTCSSGPSRSAASSWPGPRGCAEGSNRGRPTGWPSAARACSPARRSSRSRLA